MKRIIRKAIDLKYPSFIEVINIATVSKTERNPTKPQ